MKNKNWVDRVTALGHSFGRDTIDSVFNGGRGIFKCVVECLENVEECLLSTIDDVADIVDSAVELGDGLIEATGDALGVTWYGEFRKEETEDNSNRGFPVSSQIKHKILNAPTFSEEDFTETDVSEE